MEAKSTRLLQSPNSGMVTVLLTVAPAHTLHVDGRLVPTGGLVAIGGRVVMGGRVEIGGLVATPGTST